MTKTKKSERGEKAFTLHKNIQTNERNRRLLLVENISLLIEMLDNKYYQDILGDEEGEWAGYLADLEIFYSRNQVYTYIKIYKELTQNLGVQPGKWLDIPITRLSECLPFLTKKNYEDWFSKASVLTGRDWQIEIRIAKGEITEEDEHKHDNIFYKICKLCGAKHKLSSEEINDSKITTKRNSK